MINDEDFARRWLAAQGARQTDDGTWRDGHNPTLVWEPSGFAHKWAGIAMESGDLGTTDVVRVILGIGDLCGEPSVADEFSILIDYEEQHRAPVWEAFRERLEGTREPVGVIASVRDFWFVDHWYAREVFDALLGRDIADLTALAARTAPGAPAHDALLRRARRVLAVSEPVPADAKRAAYAAAAAVPDLRDALPAREANEAVSHRTRGAATGPAPRSA